MPQKNDILWKGILEDVFDDFLRFLYPNAERLFDFSKGITFLDKELEQLFPPEGDVFAPKVIDKLAKVPTHAGKTEWILVHVEVQGKYEKDLGKRMFEYFYRILDKYNRRVTAWAILTEQNKLHRSNVFQMEYLGTSLHYQFNIFKIALQPEEQLLQSKNPFAWVALAARQVFSKSVKNREQQLLDIKLLVARKLLEARFSKDKIWRILNFLRYYIKFEDAEIATIFEKEIDYLTNKATTMGIIELLQARAEHYARQEGAENKSRTVVENAIVEFGFNDEQAARIAGVTVDFVKEVRAGLESKPGSNQAN